MDHLCTYLSVWYSDVVSVEKRFKTVSQMQYYRTKFQGVTQTAAESLLDLGNKIRTLSRKAYPNLEAKLRNQFA